MCFISGLRLLPGHLSVRASTGIDGSVTYIAEMTPAPLHVTSLRWSRVDGQRMSDRSVVFTSVKDRVSALSVVRPQVTDQANLRTTAVTAGGESYTSIGEVFDVKFMCIRAQLSL